VSTTFEIRWSIFGWKTRLLTLIDQLNVCCEVCVLVPTGLNKKRYRVHSWSPSRAAIAGVCLFGFSQVCAVFAASARDQVAPSSEKQWAPPNLEGYQDTLQRASVEALQKGKELVDLRREYTLPDLIDLAQQLNPATRAAWQNAKQALALVGVNKSAYYPFLSLAAAAGYTRLFVPFPKLEVNQAALKQALASGGSALTAVTLT